MTLPLIWCSEDGSDANTGAYASPVRTFAAALSKVDAGGVIAAPFGGDFGPCSIDKSVTINAPGGVVAVDMANAINIPATVDKRITLRGLTLVGKNGAGLIGINADGGAALSLERLTVTGFRSGSALGINFAPPVGTRGVLSLTDCIIENCGVDSISGGLLVKPNNTGAALVSLARTRISECFVGLIADGEGNSGGISVSIDDHSQIIGCSGSGIIARSYTGSTVVVRMASSSLFGNACGAYIDGAKANLVSSRTIITRNGYGVSRANSGSWWTYGSNELNGNDTANGAPTGTIALT